MTTPFAGTVPASQTPWPWPGSLAAAAARLEKVIAGSPMIDPWFAQLEDALTECTAAIQYHLETIDGDDGMREHIAREEPRLISRLERLDDALQRLLPELRDVRQCSKGFTPGLIQPLAHLLAELRHADDDELSILYESLMPMGSSGD